MDDESATLPGDETQRPSPPGRSADPRDTVADAARSAVDDPEATLDPVEASGDRPGPDRPRPIPTIPGFELVRELGRGGMGVVYEARRTLLNRRCALKMILAAEHAEPGAIVRFLGEAEAVARLDHPNVVRIFGLGSHQNLPYLELEYADGGSLDRALDGVPRAPGRPSRSSKPRPGAWPRRTSGAWSTAT